MYLGILWEQLYWLMNCRKVTNRSPLRNLNSMKSEHITFPSSLSLISSSDQQKLLEEEFEHQ